MPSKYKKGGGCTSFLTKELETFAQSKMTSENNKPKNIKMGKMTQQILTDFIKDLRKQKKKEIAIQQATPVTNPGSAEEMQSKLFSGKLTDAVESDSQDPEKAQEQSQQLPSEKPKIEISEQEKAMLKSFRKLNS